MQHGLAIVGGAMVRTASSQNELEAFATISLLLFAVIFVSRHWTPQHPEPARVLRRPVHVLQRHTHDGGTKRTSATPKKLLCDGMAGKIVRFDMSVDFAGKHLASDL